MIDAIIAIKNTDKTICALYTKYEPEPDKLPYRILNVFKDRKVVAKCNDKFSEIQGVDSYASMIITYALNSLISDKQLRKNVGDSVYTSKLPTGYFYIVPCEDMTNKRIHEFSSYYYEIVFSKSIGVIKDILKISVYNNGNLIADNLSFTQYVKTFLPKEIKNHK